MKYEIDTPEPNEPNKNILTGKTTNLSLFTVTLF